MAYLLDTNAAIALLKENPQLVHHVRRVGRTALKLCAPVEAELWYGIVKNREALRMAQDIVSVWSKECCIANPSIMTETSALYANWREWCKQKDIGCGSIKAFSQRLGLLGWKRGLEGSNRHSVFYGVSISH